jgi:hypothetical protein
LAGGTLRRRSTWWRSRPLDGVPRIELAVLPVERTAAEGRRGIDLGIPACLASGRRVDLVDLYDVPAARALEAATGPEYLPCRVVSDPVDHDYYLVGYEASRRRSPFKHRLYARVNRPGRRRRDARIPNRRDERREG